MKIIGAIILNGDMPLLLSVMERDSCGEAMLEFVLQMLQGG